MNILYSALNQKVKNNFDISEFFLKCEQNVWVHSLVRVCDCLTYSNDDIKACKDCICRGKADFTWCFLGIYAQCGGGERERTFFPSSTLWQNLTLFTFHRPHFEIPSDWRLGFQHTNLEKGYSTGIQLITRLQKIGGGWKDTWQIFPCPKMRY